MDDEAKRSKPFEDEFERLGENLRRAVEQAWQSEERRQFSAELQSGIEELGTALNQTANDFAESPTGRRMRAEVDDWSRRVQEGEVADKVESELVSVLGRLNQYLEQVISSMASEPGSDRSNDES